MALVYLLAGVSSGSLAALGCLMMGHPAVVAGAAYVAFGALCIVALAMCLSYLRLAQLGR